MKQNSALILFALSLFMLLFVSGCADNPLGGASSEKTAPPVKPQGGVMQHTEEKGQ
jgi:hypothetical protein